MSETAQENTTESAPRGLRLGKLHFSAVEMLIALVLLFVATPFIEGLPDGDIIEVAFTAVFFFSAVMAVGGRRRMLIVSVVLVVPALAARWLNHFHPHVLSALVFFVNAIVLLVFLIVHILRFVLRTRRVNGEVLCASISVYLMFGLLWAMAFRLVAHLNPAAFTFNAAEVVNQPMEGFTAFYFSFVTLTTVGYGDITPVSPIARMLAVMEAMTGTLYVAVLIARLVALYSTSDPSTPSNKSDSFQS